VRRKEKKPTAQLETEGVRGARVGKGNADVVEELEAKEEQPSGNRASRLEEKSRPWGREKLSEGT